MNKNPLGFISFLLLMTQSPLHLFPERRKKKRGSARGKPPSTMSFAKEGPFRSYFYSLSRRCICFRRFAKRISAARPANR